MSAAGRWLLAALILAGCSPAQGGIACAVSGHADKASVLLIGDSWTGRGRLNQPLADEVALRSGGATVCSLSFPGKTAAEIADLLPRIPRRFDHVALVVGVNDVVRHTGRTNYASGVARLAVKATTFSPDVRLVAIPRVDLSHPHGDAERHAKAALLNDGGVADMTGAYRAAAPRLATIAFDPFIPSYAGHERDYKGDGIHLTERSSRRFGQYLGRALTASP